MLAAVLIESMAYGASGSQGVAGSGPATKPAYDVWRREMLAELTSTDDARVSAALEQLREHLKADWRHRGRDIQVLLDAKRYADAEAMASEFILFDPHNTIGMADLEKVRARALLSAGKPTEALSAAKAYYDTAPLRATADAINTVSLCLAAAHPDDKGIVKRFKRQQLAGAATQPAAPAAGDAANAEQAADLGEPILASIAVDPRPFAEAIDAMPLDDYKQYVAKGNLLLAAGRAKEARALFERAVDLADEKSQAEAIENVARAIRAESGRIGPANAYILALRDKGQ